jgi:hypothetical protein
MSQLGVDGSILTVTGFAGAMERECYASDLLRNHSRFTCQMTTTVDLLDN